MKPDKLTQDNHFTLETTYRLQKPCNIPIHEQPMLRHSGIMMWLELQKVGRRTTKAESFSNLVVNLKTFHNYQHNVPRCLRNNQIFSFVTDFGPFIKHVVNHIDINVTRFSHPVGIGTPIKHLVAIVAAQYVVRIF